MCKLNELLTQLCPCGIKYSPLSNVCKSLPKGTLKTGDLNQNGKYPVINSGKDFYGRYQEYNNEGNVFTLAARGEYAGFVTYIEHRFWAGGLCYPYRSKNEDELLTKFVYYFLKQQENTIMSTLVARGSIPALNKADIDKIMIPLPPLPVQREIVRILDNFTELTAELTAELAARRKQYEFYRDKLLTSTNGLSTQSLGDVCNVIAGGTPSKKNSNFWDGGTIKWLGSTVCQNQKTVDSITDYITEEGLASSSAKIMRKDTTLIALVGATIGKIAFLPFEAAINQNIVGVYPKDTTVLDPSYVYYACTALYPRFLALTQGSKLAMANLSFVRGLQIPVPPLNVQKRIVNVLDNFDAICSDLNVGLPAEIEARQKQYEYYRDKLLTFKELEG